MIRTLFSLGTILAVAAIVATGTNAFFGDQESSIGNTFAAGDIDLKIDNESYYNGALNEGTSWGLADLNDAQGPGPDGAYFFFNFLDLKPDDEGEDTISLHVDTNDAWACMDVTVRDFDDNGCNEPEGADGDNTCSDDEGELQNEINFIWWADDGDNVLVTDEANGVFYGPQSLASLELHIPLSDSTGEGIFGSEPLQGDETYYIGKAWCFGELTLDPVAEGEGENPTVASGILCDGTGLDNTTQTDSVVGDISFRATQSRNYPDFECNPEPVACELVETYADEVVSSDQGLRKNGTAVLADRSDPSFALGAPQSLGTPYDNPVIPSSFFSLGFPFLPDNPAEIVLSFNDNLVVNGPGMDLKLWEVTGGTNYPDEVVDVYVGDAPAGPWTLVGDNVTRDAEIDLGSVTEAQYVRIVDASNVALFESTADGYDLDAVQALNCVVPDDNGENGNGNGDGGTGTLTLEKTVVGSGQNPNDNSWTLVATGPIEISNHEGHAEVTNAAVPTGDYVLTEQSDPAGFELTNLECTGGVLVGNTVTVADGADVVCTFTNTEIPT